jgi:hypothetical protein
VHGVPKPIRTIFYVVLKHQHARAEGQSLPTFPWFAGLGWAREPGGLSSCPAETKLWACKASSGHPVSGGRSEFVILEACGPCSGTLLEESRLL